MNAFEIFGMSEAQNDNGHDDVAIEAHCICPEYNETPQFQYERSLYKYNKYYENQKGPVEDEVPHCGGLVRDFRPLGIIPGHVWCKDPTMPNYLKEDLRDPMYDMAWRRHGSCGYHIMDFRLKKHVSEIAESTGSEDADGSKWLHVLLVVNEGDMRADNISGRWGGAFVVHWKWSSSQRQESNVALSAKNEDDLPEEEEEKKEDVLVIDRLEPALRIFSVGEWGEETTLVQQMENFVWADHPNMDLSPFDFPWYNKYGYEVGFNGGQFPGKYTSQLEKIIGMAIVNNWKQGGGTIGLPESLKCRLIDPETVFGYHYDIMTALQWEDQSDGAYVPIGIEEEDEMSMDEYQEEEDFEVEGHYSNKTLHII